MADEFIVKGVNGQLVVHETKIIISRKGALGFLTQGLKGEKEILISQISSIQLKKAGTFTNGFIQFAFLGGHETKGGIFNATQDENTIMFSAKQQESFLKAKELIEKHQFGSNKPVSIQTSSFDDLEKLASLRDKNIITQEEFDLKKKQILGI